MMTRKDVEQKFIRIDGYTVMRIKNHSGLDLRQIRSGNRFYSSCNTCLFNRFKDKKSWKVVIYSYYKVTDPRYFNGRNLEAGDHYLNPEFKYLLDEV